MVIPRQLRYTLLLLALVAAESVWVAMLNRALGRTEAGGVIGWMPIFVAAAVIVILYRWLIIRGLWGTLTGRLLSLTVALLMVLALMRVAVPHQVTLLAPHRTFLQAILDLRNLSARAPLAVILITGGLLWWRAAATVKGTVNSASVHQVSRAATYQLVMLIGIFLFGTAQNILFPVRSVFLFLGSVLIAIALARAEEVGRSYRNLSLPFNLRWLGTLVGAVGSTLLLALIVSQILSFQMMDLLYNVLAPLRYLLGLLLAFLVSVMAVFLLPLLRWIASRIEPVERPQLPAARPTEELPSELTDLPQPAIAGDLLVPLFVLVVVLLLVVFIYYVLKKVHGARGEEPEVEGEYGKITGAEAWQPGDWLRRQASTLRDHLRRRSSKMFGTETVRDLYRNLLLFGDEHGLPRPEGDTPYEYLEPLCERYPQRRDDLFALTDAYVSVRYGERSFSPADLRRLQNAWRRIAELPEGDRQ